MKPVTLLVALSSLLLAVLSLEWFWQPQGGAMRWGLKAIPLLLTLPGQWRLQPRALQWLGFVLLFIMADGILGIFSPVPGSRIPGILSTSLALGLFVLLLRAIKQSRTPKES